MSSLQASPPGGTGEDGLRRGHANGRTAEGENRYRRCRLLSTTDLGVFLGQQLVHFQTFISSALHGEDEDEGNPFKAGRV